MQSLIWLLATPYIGSLAAFATPSISPRNFKRMALIFSLIPLLLLLSGQSGWVGSAINYPWMPALAINFHQGIDALSLVFLYLAAIVVPISIASVKSSNLAHPHAFYGLVLLLQGLLFCFFTARDLAVFAFFWEGMLIPLYFIISIWGKEGRYGAALKFLIYMIAGSCLMVAAILSLFFTTGAGTFEMESLAKIASSSPHATFVCAIFLLAFAVKTPLFPFHAWLPDAYYQASVPGTILLAAILSKAGIYGIFRVVLAFFPDLTIAWSPVLLGLAITGVLYGALAAWRQSDFKKLIAYSSFSHVNFILAGLFVWSQASHQGAILQAVNHGITIAALFLAAGWLEQRLGTTVMGTYTGLAKYLPMLCWVTFVFVLSSIALPSTNNFVGELLILFGLFGVHPWATALLALSIVFSVVYMLRFMQKVYFETATPFQTLWFDLQLREWAVAVPLMALIMWIGIYPAPVLKQIEPAVEKISISPLSQELQ